MPEKLSVLRVEGHADFAPWITVRFVIAEPGGEHHRRSGCRPREIELDEERIRRAVRRERRVADVETPAVGARHEHAPLIEGERRGALIAWPSEANRPRRVAARVERQQEPVVDVVIRVEHAARRGGPGDAQLAVEVPHDRHRLVLDRALPELDGCGALVARGARSPCPQELAARVEQRHERVGIEIEPAEQLGAALGLDGAGELAGDGDRPAAQADVDAVHVRRAGDAQHARPTQRPVRRELGDERDAIFRDDQAELGDGADRLARDDHVAVGSDRDPLDLLRAGIAKALGPRHELPPGRGVLEAVRRLEAAAQP